jgi:hypothetical protein
MPYKSDEAGLANASEARNGINSIVRRWRFEKIQGRMTS